MLVDYHIHTTHSIDGHATMSQVCRRAVEVRLSEIAITDHLDKNPADEGADFYNVDKWFDDYDRTREATAGQLIVRAGIEIGEPHEYRPLIEEMLTRPFDVVIGSVHYVGPLGVHASLFADMAMDEALTSYFEKQLAVANCGLIDVLAHLDYFQRYTAKQGLPPFDPIQWEPRIRSILEVVIRNDLALEVNTSGVRQKPGACFPGRTILSWYHEMGGRAVTVGSDAHYAEHVGANIADATALLRGIGFDSLCVFERRRRHTIPLP